MDIFKGVFDTSGATTITPEKFLLCIAVALVIGAFLALTYSYKTRHTKSFLLTLATLPAIVCVVIMMVNGNIGAGVAVAGAFSLVRFRSVPGTAREIGTIFLAMGSGLVCGMGYLGFAALFAAIVGTVMFLYTLLSTGSDKNKPRLLKITIPEDLDYTDVFKDIFEEYTKSHHMLSVKTTNLGSMFKLRYEVVLNDISREKEFIDKIRIRNGNLEVSLGDTEGGFNEL